MYIDFFFMLTKVALIVQSHVSFVQFRVCSHYFVILIVQSQFVQFRMCSHYFVSESTESFGFLLILWQHKVSLSYCLLHFGQAKDHQALASISLLGGLRTVQFD